MKTREVYKGKFTRAENSLLESLEESLQGKSNVEKRFKILQVAWNAAQEKHEFYFSLLPAEQLDENWIAELAVRYEKREEEIAKYLLDLEKGEAENERNCFVSNKNKRKKRELPVKWSHERKKLQSYCYAGR